MSADHGVVSRVAQPARSLCSQYLPRSITPNDEVARWLRSTARNIVAARRISRAATEDHSLPSGEDTMTRIAQIVRSLARQDEGQDLLEYALLVALIALVAVGAVTAAGVQVNNIFGQIAGAI